MKASRKSSGAAAELRRRSEGRNGSTGRRSIEWDRDSRKMKHREAAEALPRSLAEIKLAFGEDYEEMKLVEEEEQEMKTINTVERLAKQKGISNEIQAEVTKIQIQAEVMNQESHDEGTENVEEQVTEEMKKALDSNGFIGSTIDLVTGAAMAVMKGEVFDGASGESTEEDKLKSAEKKRRLRELMDPGAAPHIRAETRAEKEVEQTQFIGRKWREEGPKGPGYYLSYVAVAGQLLALAEQDEIKELMQEVKTFEPEGRQLQDHMADSVLAVGKSMATNTQNQIRHSSARRMSAAEDLQSQSATSTRKMQEEVIKAQENYEAISAELETLQGKLDELEAELPNGLGAAPWKETKQQVARACPGSYKNARETAAGLVDWLAG
ncbi:MAG: hypothetical protein CBB78_000415, partial [Roseibacillus sp. TMED18]